MAGMRLQPPGWSAISAVCTARDARGRGHATVLVRSLLGHIASHGRRAFLHVAESNAAAMELYGRLGFVPRTRVTFHGYRVP
jgi:predicted GNAT family acetyltransferase